MARLDERLLPLLEILGASGADWLAFELVEGIRAGRIDEESTDALERARTSVPERLTEAVRTSEDTAEIPQPVDLVGDEQIDWAMEYVNARLGDSLEMLESSLEGLDAILQGVPGTELPARTDITLVLQDGEEYLQVDRSAAADAIQELERLTSALSNWGLSTRGEQI
jgi:hypothetical protein